MATKFNETKSGEEFVASAESRNTSREIMEAIAYLARNLEEAEALWRGDGFGVVCNHTDIWEIVTGNGRREATEFVWGAHGNDWWDAIKGDDC